MATPLFEIISGVMLGLYLELGSTLAKLEDRTFSRFKTIGIYRPKNLRCHPGHASFYPLLSSIRRLAAAKRRGLNYEQTFLLEQIVMVLF